MKEDWVSSDYLIWAMLRFSHKAIKEPALGFFKGEFSLPEGLILWTSTNIAAVSRCFIAAFQNVFGCLVSCSRPSFSIFTQHLLLWMFFAVAVIAFVVFLKPLTKRGEFLNVWVLTPHHQSEKPRVELIVVCRQLNSQVLAGKYKPGFVTCLFYLPCRNYYRAMHKIYVMLYFKFQV